jgi:hypothetical protein
VNYISLSVFIQRHSASEDFPPRVILRKKGVVTRLNKVKACKQDYLEKLDEGREKL